MKEGSKLTPTRLCLIPVGLAALALAGCGSSSSNSSNPLPTELSYLPPSSPLVLTRRDRSKRERDQGSERVRGEVPVRLPRRGRAEVQAPAVGGQLRQRYQAAARRSRSVRRHRLDVVRRKRAEQLRVRLDDEGRRQAEVADPEDPRDPFLRLARRRDALQRTAVRPRWRSTARPSSSAPRRPRSRQRSTATLTAAASRRRTTPRRFQACRRTDCSRSSGT